MHLKQRKSALIRAWEEAKKWSSKQNSCPRSSFHSCISLYCALLPYSYFNMSIWWIKKIDMSNLLNRSYCFSNDMTRGGSRPRSPSLSLSVKGKPVSCEQEINRRVRLQATSTIPKPDPTKFVIWFQSKGKQGLPQAEEIHAGKTLIYSGIQKVKSIHSVTNL